MSQLSTRKKDRYVAPNLGEKYGAFGPSPLSLMLFDERDQIKSPALIKHLKEILRWSPDRVKILISNFSFPAMENDLKIDPSIGVTAARNKDDVREFIETTLDDRIKDRALLDGVVEPDLSRKIRDTLTGRAQNVFLSASFLPNQLCGENHTNDAESIRKKHDGLPRNLVSRNIQPHHRRESRRYKYLRPQPPPNTRSVQSGDSVRKPQKRHRAIRPSSPRHLRLARG